MISRVLLSTFTRDFTFRCTCTFGLLRILCTSTYQQTFRLLHIILCMYSYLTANVLLINKNVLSCFFLCKFYFIVFDYGKKSLYILCILTSNEWYTSKKYLFIVLWNYSCLFFKLNFISFYLFIRIFQTFLLFLNL